MLDQLKHLMKGWTAKEGAVYTKDELKQILSNGVSYVLFNKVDGSLRPMYCTLDPQFLPQREPTERTVADNPDVLRVYDMDVEDWRSFRVASVVRVVHREVNAVSEETNRPLVSNEDVSGVVSDLALGALLASGSDPVMTTDSGPVFVGGGGTFDGGGASGDWQAGEEKSNSDSGNQESSCSVPSDSSDVSNSGSNDDYSSDSCSSSDSSSDSSSSDSSSSSSSDSE